MLFIILVSFTSFGFGLFLKSLLSTEQNPLPPPEKPISPVKTDPSEMNSNYKFYPGSHYIEDTVILMTKQQPHITLVATNVRLQQKETYLQNSRVSYYDGSDWHRELKSQNIKDIQMYSNSLIKKWETEINTSRVLQESNEGEIEINKDTLVFSTGVLSNEMSVRSLPSYTKFLSKGNGTLTVNGKEYSAYVLYSRVYSLNANDIQFYDAPLGLTTVWAVFWDELDNLYFVDTTEVKNPVPTYQTHKLGIVQSDVGSITKTFDLSVDPGTGLNPKNFEIQLNEPIQQNLSLNVINSLNKATRNSQTWYFGQVNGTVKLLNDNRTINGVGLIEFIKD